ncbi:MAG: ribonuclease R [Myxococcota bacterium]
MIEHDELVELIGAAGRLVGVKEILRAGGFHPGQQTDLKRALRELVKEGRLTRDGKRFGIPDVKGQPKSGPAWGGRKVQEVARRSGGGPRRAQQGEGWSRGGKAPPRGRTVEGIIHHHKDGFAFVKPIVGQSADEDIFIPPDQAKRALDHDRVVVEVVPGRGGRTMGRLVDVTSRTRQLVVGTYFEDAKGAWVEPREAELGAIRVPPTQLARPGDAVKVRLGIGEALVKAGDRLVGEVAGSLGSPDDHSVEVLSVAFARGFHDEFPPEVMDEADAIPVEVSEEDKRSEHRRDLRKLPLITIDGEDARDFDDAIYVEEHPKGWRLVVAIADVSHYVQEKTALDAEGLRRATSVYLPGRVLPMLPERLSNGLCSLKPDVDRLCMVADMVIDSRGTTLDTELYPAVMRSHARCTYTEVHQVLNGEHVPGRTELAPLFQRANELAKTLTKMRRDRGSIDFDLPERRVELDEKGLPARMVQRERWESHRLVEECMLAANEAVARYFREKGLPTVNRYHGLPDEERLATFLGLLRAYGVEVKSEELTSKELNAVLSKLEGHPEQRALNQLALRSMMQAVYSSKESGHYGLGAEDYLHFTSPIRRYPDLLVHRLLKHSWSKKKKYAGHALEQELDRLEALAVQCSERERAAMQVEREVSALYSCLLVKDRVGESFAGTVSGLSENGFYVELDELHVDGFVRGELVYPDFEFDQSTYRLVFGSGHVVKVGQKLQVTLAAVNLQRKQIDLTPDELGETLPSPQWGEGQGEGKRGRSSVRSRPRSAEREKSGRGGRDERRGDSRFGGREASRGRDDRGGRGGREARGGIAGRGGRDDEGGRFGGRGGRDARGDFAGRGGRDDSGWRGGRDARGGFAGRGERDDSGGRGGRDARGGFAARGGRDDSGGRGGRHARGDFAGGGGREDAREGRGGRDKSGGRRDSGSRFGGKGRASGKRSGGRFGAQKRTPGGAAFVRGEPDERIERWRGGSDNRRSPQPPPQPWDRPSPREGEPEVREPDVGEGEKPAASGFDPRTVLDRLWKERGGRGGNRR